ncbi:MAG: glycosyltransferase [Anaerolineae bacterium]|nr:glycosyltransferase [Anaerolineae bacterium]
MHLLLLTPQFPYPPHQGATLRNFHLLRGLAVRHTVDLFSLLAPDDDPTAGPVREWVRLVVTAPQPRRTARQRLRNLLTSPLPDMALRLWNPAAMAVLEDYLSRHRPDLIQVQGLEMAHYALNLFRRIERPPVVYDAYNVEAILQERAFLADLRRPQRWPAAAYSAVQTLKLRRYEHRFVRMVTALTAVSAVDAALLRALAPDKPLAIVSNGVDMAAYDPDAAYPNPYPSPGPHLVFTGKMDFRPNVDAALWFAEKVLPRLQAAGWQAHFWVVGRSPHPRLERLRGRPDVTLTGAVPDVRPYLAHADLFVAPLLAGGGTRLKLLEAMAMARPIVSTRIGAEGFPVCDGQEMALADTAAEFAARCAQLLSHPDEAAALGRRGRSLAAHYDWGRIVPALEGLYQELGLI